MLGLVNISSSTAGRAAAGTILDKRGRFGMARLRLIPALDKMPAVVRRVETLRGRAVLLLAFLLVLSIQVQGRRWIDTAVVLTAVVFVPQHRRRILVFGALYWSLVHVNLPLGLIAQVTARAGRQGETAAWIPPSTLVAAALLCCALAHQWVLSRPSSLLARQPAWALTAAYGTALMLLSSWQGGGSLWVWSWAIVLVLGRYLWFLAYSLVDARKLRTRGFTVQMGLYQPFWGSTNTPFPKGEAYARQIEAATPGALAVSQLKGFKLLVWSCLLLAARELLTASLYGTPSRLPWGISVLVPVPTLAAAIRASMVGEPLSWSANWAAMLADLAVKGLNLSVWGHRYIAIARMAGFQARRNTYKPFLATSLSEFFNRYYYYFKELLVDCFFYPVFLSTLRKRFVARLLVATLAAAGLGNFLFHFFRDVHFVVERGFVQALIDARLHLFYCVVLAIAVFASQLRRLKGRREPAGILARARAILFVWLAFAALNSMIDRERNSTVSQHLAFLADSLPLR